MPKMKTHKGAAKRFGVTGSGKVVRVKSLARPPPGHQVVAPHPPLRGQGRRSTTRSAEQVKRLLPYLKG